MPSSLFANGITSSINARFPVSDTYLYTVGKSHRASSALYAGCPVSCTYEASSGVSSCPGLCVNLTSGSPPPLSTWAESINLIFSTAISGARCITPCISCTVSRYPYPFLRPQYVNEAALDQINVIKQLYAFHVFIIVLNSSLGVLI